MFEHAKRWEIRTCEGMNKSPEVCQMLVADEVDPDRVIDGQCDACNWPGGLNVPAAEQADLEFPEGESIPCSRSAREYERCPRMKVALTGSVHAAGLCDPIHCHFCQATGKSARLLIGKVYKILGQDRGGNPTGALMMYLGPRGKSSLCWVTVDPYGEPNGVRMWVPDGQQIMDLTAEEKKDIADKVRIRNTQGSSIVIANQMPPEGKVAGGIKPK